MGKAASPGKRKQTGTPASAAISLERIERSVLLVRGQRVMVDADLAALYSVETRILNQAVRRNRERFPEDFMFQLTWEEAESARSQVVILKDEITADSRSQSVTLKRGLNVKYRPYVFTEQGVAMLSSVLRSKRAVAVNVEIMRVFVRLRHAMAAHKEIAQRLESLERDFKHRSKEHQEHIGRIYEIIEALMEPPAPAKMRRIGFVGKAMKNPPEVQMGTSKVHETADGKITICEHGRSLWSPPHPPNGSSLALRARMLRMAASFSVTTSEHLRSSASSADCLSS